MRYLTAWRTFTCTRLTPPTISSSLSFRYTLGQPQQAPHLPERRPVPVPPVGLEPTAIRLKVCCSNQLSYRGVSSPGPLARAHARNASGGTVRAAVCEGIQRPACLHYRPRSPIDATGEPYQTRPPDAPANKSADGAATCYRGRQRTVGRARLALAVWTGYLCLIYSHVPSLLGQRPMRHEKDQR